MNNILTVCVGNICRSPIAEGLLARYFPEKRVWSAGVAALVGKPADPFAVDVAKEHGLDLSAHRANQLAGWMCTAADLILVMESGHKKQIEAQFPLVRGKVFRVAEFDKSDIADPYRLPRAAFEAVFGQIDRGVAEWVQRLRKIA